MFCCFTFSNITTGEEVRIGFVDKLYMLKREEIVMIKIEIIFKLNYYKELKENIF